MAVISDKTCSRKFQLSKISHLAGSSKHNFLIVHDDSSLDYVFFYGHCDSLSSILSFRNKKGAAGAAPDVQVKDAVTVFQEHPRADHRQGGCKSGSLKCPGAPAPSARQAGRWWPRKGGLQTYAADHAESGSFQYRPSSARSLFGWLSASGKDVFLCWTETVRCIALCFAGIVLSGIFSTECGGRFL